VHLIYPAWSPDNDIFPFSASNDAVSATTSYASNVDTGVRAMLDDDVSGDDVIDNVRRNFVCGIIDGFSKDDVRGNLVDDVSGDAGAGGQMLGVDEWIGNTSTFLRVIGDATTKVHHLVTSERFTSV